MRAAAAAPLLALVVGISGCASDNSASSRLPTCVEGDVTNGVILMAQSVPSATWVPCLRTNLPLGWSFVHLEARNGSSRFSLDSNRDGDKAIEVLFEQSCDTTGATEIPSDRAGLQRFERVRLTTPRYEGERYYVFDGGCITFVFHLIGDSRGEPLALATQSIGAISRADLIALVHDESDGRLSLDPAGDGQG